MGYKAILKELKDTPTDQLKELPGNEVIDVVTEEQVMNELGRAESLSPDDEETIEPDFVIVDDEDTDSDPDDNNDQGDDDDDDESGDEDVDPNEPTEIDADNFFTADQAVGLLDNGVVMVEELIFKLADVDVNKKDLHYTAKQKKLLAKPLEKAFKKTKFRIKSPWLAVGITFAGLEFAKITKILADNKIEKKHKAALDEKDRQVAQLQAQIINLMQEMERNAGPQPQHYHVTPEYNAAHGANQPGTGPVMRNDRGQFAPGTGQHKRKKGVSTRKPGETRGRKTGQTRQTIPLNAKAN